MRLVLVTRKQMDERERLIRIEARQDAHEDGCTQKWAAADSSIQEVKNDVQALSDKLDRRFDDVAEKRDHQHAANTRYLIGILLAVLGYICSQAFPHLFTALNK